MMIEGLIAATIAAASIISPATASAGQPMAAALGTLDPRAVMVISQSARGVGYAGDVQVVLVAGPTFTRPVLSAVPPRPPLRGRLHPARAGTDGPETNQ